MEYLIALSIGPVQDFIAAAHKTRDLWFGSYVLSEVSKAAAKYLKEEADLIFPAHNADLEKEGFNVANKLLVKAETDNPGELVENAKEAARGRWKELADLALDKVGERNIRKAVWYSQVDDVLELFGAWVPLSDDYDGSRQKVESLLSARKATRDFEPAKLPADIKGLPKSSLDAARETVLLPTKNKKGDYRKLHLSQNEQLDCPGVVKRLCGGEPQRFPAITRIALQAWIDLKNIPEDAFKEINAYYSILQHKDEATAVATDIYKALPYDGGLMFPERIALKKSELEAEEDADNKLLIDALDCIQDKRQPLYKKYGEPSPYFVILVADGDRMGVCLDACKDSEQHQEISRKLAEFAEQAKETVRQNKGAAVYTGGDDVMALLPVHTAIACAQALSNEFREILKDGVPQNTPTPTLSVGLGIEHIFSPFTLAIDLGRRAEKLAKGSKLKDKDKAAQRNALGIILNIRSGSELELRARWDSGIVEKLKEFQKWYEDDEIPGSLPYEMKEAVDRMDWAKNDNFAAITQEIRRVLKKKRDNAGNKLKPCIIEKIEKAVREHGTDITTTISQLRLARWLSGKFEKGAG